MKLTLRAYDTIRGDIGGIEARSEGSNAVVSEAQRCGSGLVDLGQPCESAVDGYRRYMRWLSAKEVARGIDAVDPDVVERATTERALRTNVAGANRHRKRRIEELERSELPASRDVDGRKVEPLEMEPVRDHQLDLRFATRGDHLSTFLNRDRHRFFA